MKVEQNGSAKVNIKTVLYVKTKKFEVSIKVESCVAPILFLNFSHNDPQHSYTLCPYRNEYIR